MRLYQVPRLWLGNFPAASGVSTDMRIPASPRPRWTSFFFQIGLLYSQILLLLLLGGILVFHFAWGYEHRSRGLLVIVGLTPMMKSLTCAETWTVRIDTRENWYLNSTKTSQKELAGVLNQRLGGKTNCAVYLDLDASLSYAV